jgi:serine beta-lactamase-like protein LACTB, mitochondrial
MLRRHAAVPGAAAAVAVGGQIVWSEGFGQASRETPFGIGSISKALTLAAAMTLVDEGRLDLDAPIERYLPDWPHRGRGITARRLAARQSGLADSFADEHYTATAHFPDLDSAYRHIRNESAWRTSRAPEPCTPPDSLRFWAGCWSR